MITANYPTTHLCPVCLITRAQKIHARCRALITKTREKVITETNRELSEAEIVFLVKERVGGVYARKQA